MLGIDTWPVQKGTNLAPLEDKGKSGCASSHLLGERHLTFQWLATLELLSIPPGHRHEARRMECPPSTPTRHQRSLGTYGNEVATPHQGVSTTCKQIHFVP